MNKLFLPKKKNVLKNSEKVPYSKSGFYYQIIKYSLVPGITLTNDKYRNKNSQHHRALLFSNSLNLIHVGVVQIYALLFCKPVFP